MKKACIIVDSSSGIINGQYSDVFVVPLILIEKKANNELISYRDDVEIKLEEVYQKLRDNKNISTSQANMQDMVSALEKYSKEYENVFVIPIPKTLSSNVDTWEMIAKEFNNVSVFRQFTLANPLDWMIRHFVEKNVNNELNATYIENYIQQTKNKFCIALIVPDIT
jgi:fatty acid-binding protein DegV